MKFATFEDDGPRPGAVIGNLVLDIAAAMPSAPASLRAILAGGLLPAVRNLVDNAAELDHALFRRLEETRLLPPIPDPGKIICLGLNYAGHAREQGREPPPHPILFAKAVTALAGPFDEIVIPADVDRVDAEAELAVVIGRDCFRVDPFEALDHVAGYMAFNDVSARRVQRDDRQWFRGKGFDTFAPCGPWIVTPDETGDPGDLPIAQRLNGRVMQEGSTADMIFDVPSIVHFVSAGMTLRAGDVIATGTPAGVGVFRDPPVFLSDGDVVEIGVGRIGTIRNRVRIEQRGDG
ncbi:MAG: fumarylacetoacetate hydrolase family protein [Candidatus Krumholzibacteriota bacterium]|nr:fumarylacetoacetate hydrolase family protein [Candidatus Krumholzibacteriota bacterium]